MAFSFWRNRHAGSDAGELWCWRRFKVFFLEMHERGWKSWTFCVDDFAQVFPRPAWCSTSPNCARGSKCWISVEAWEPSPWRQPSTGQIWELCHRMWAPKPASWQMRTWAFADDQFVESAMKIHDILIYTVCYGEVFAVKYFKDCFLSGLTVS